MLLQEQLLVPLLLLLDLFDHLFGILLVGFICLLPVALQLDLG